MPLNPRHSPDKPPLTPAQALLGLHIGALAFGLSGIFGKLAPTAPLVIVFGRSLFAVLSLLPFACQGLPDIGKRQWAILTGAGLLLAGHWLTFFMAVKTSGVAIATLGFATFPAFTALLESLIFQERIRRSEVILIALVTLGLVMVTPSLDIADQSTLGLLEAILSGLLFAILTLVNRAASATGRSSPLQASLCQNLTIVVCLIPFVWSGLPELRLLDWLWLFLLGSLCTAVAHSLFVSSLKVLKARTAAMIFTLEPVYGIAFAAVLFHEIPGWRTLIGGVTIILSIFVASRQIR